MLAAADARPGWQARACFLAGRGAGALSRLTGRGQGRTISGRVALALRSDALAELAASRDVVLVSGTNGKSTTTRMLATALSWQRPVVSNEDGSNLARGLVGALLATARSSATAVLEVDELVLPAAMEATKPRVVVLLNLSRDQLDRVGEVASHLRRWAQALSLDPAATVVANAADPLVVTAVRAARPDDEQVVWVDAGWPWTADAPLCPRCSSAWDPTRIPWHCRGCGLAMPSARWRLDGLHVVDGCGRRLPLDLAVAGRSAAANAVMAVAAAHLLGVPVDAALSRVRSVHDIGGRYLRTQLSGRPVQLLLAKNPGGWLDLLSQLERCSGTIVLGVNARGADGTDPSWLWDVAFERLRGRHVVVYGDRATDLSVRLHYAEVPHVVSATVEDALAAAGEEVVVVANYTAFVDARDVVQRLARR